MSRRSPRRSRGIRSVVLTVAGVLVALALPALAAAHLERPSYWPDPRPDKSIEPKAGGEVPDRRTLRSAVSDRDQPGQVRVVCKGDGGGGSLDELDSSIESAQEKGFRIRPSQDKLVLSNQQADRLRDINRELAQECEYKNIQEAVFDSGNNDRVVVMPGRYREHPSRDEPTNDPRCADLVQDNGSGGMAPSYRYQVTCPNDQNLIYVQGRAIGDDPPPEPPRAEREGIPDLGRCVRCNFQIEGSGVKPTDVVMDAGKNYKGSGPNAKPGTADGCNFEPECAYAKDVVLRVDRADGFVGRNFLTKSSTEHGVYIEETDGYLLDTTKFFWSAEYGNLTFTSDHGVYKNCDSYGAGDAAVYPGAAPETGEDVEDESFYPDAPRINTVVKKCDLRSSALAYSGSQGNAVRIKKNHIYANTTGIVTDSISASGHPGYPPDSVEVDHNKIYSNNLDSYNGNPPFVNTVGLPIGVGIFWPGVNSTTVHDNRIFDNWRRGTMLVGIPTAATRGTPEDPSPSACDNAQFATSCHDTYTDNRMGSAPRGFKPPGPIGKFGNPSSLDGGDRNGVDFWWDEFPGNKGNCWPNNVGPDGTRDSLTGDPPINPVAGINATGFLPEECDEDDPTWAAGIGTGDVPKEIMLLICGTMYEPGETDAGNSACEWFVPPAEPGSQAAARQQREFDATVRRFKDTEEGARLRERLRSLSTVAPRR